MNSLIAEGKNMKKIPALKDESSGRLIYDQQETYPLKELI